jgi:hypothetical protein
MWKIFIWGFFILIITISILNREIDTPHYLLYSLTILYIYYIFYKIKT